MKRVFLLLFFFLLLFNWLDAQQVDYDKAKQVAVNFLAHKSPSQDWKAELRQVNPPDYPFYVFSSSEAKAFVIVSSNEGMYPVLAYSLESDFDFSRSLPPALQGWLDTAARITRLVERKNIGSKYAKALWERFLNGDFSYLKTAKATGPLLSTLWGQGKYYNAMCPTDPAGPDGHVWTGCVATAMAQVLKYWGYPEYGSSQHSYTHYEYGELSADFASTHYLWDSMPASLSDYNDEVARLMYHCGVAVNMNYSPSGSGAYMTTALRALKNFFDYNRQAGLVYRYSANEQYWDSLIAAEILQSRPVLYAGYGTGGHAFVVDGFDEADSSFHVNWGWSGSYNGWFLLDDLTPGSSDFTSGQQAVINLFPQQGDTTSIVLTDSAGYIFDNGGGYFYKNNSLNTWLIAAPDAQAVYLKFLSFKLVPGQDTLYIFDGSDENAALLAVLSQDSLPQPILSTSPEVYLKFVSDTWNAEEGFWIKYNTKRYDVQITRIVSPSGVVSCPVTDSVVIGFRNDGYDTIYTIYAQTVIFDGTVSEEFFDTISGVFPPESYTIVKLLDYDFQNRADYRITVRLSADGDIYPQNDTMSTVFGVRPVLSLPWFEDFDSLTYENYHLFFNDSTYWTGLNYPGDSQSDTSGKFMVMYYYRPGFWQQVYYTFPLKSVSGGGIVRFDYRVLVSSYPPVSDSAYNDTLVVMYSTDCGQSWSEIYRIDSSNYIPDTQFVTVQAPFAITQGQEFLFGFKFIADNQGKVIYIDNILLADSLSGNVLSGFDCSGNEVLIEASEVAGGLEPLSYVWEYSDDGQTWIAFDTLSTSGGVSFPIPDSVVYIRRIVTDSLGMVDTSNVLTVLSDACQPAGIDILPNPSEGLFSVIVPGYGYVEVADLSGRVVYRSAVSAGRAEVDLRGLTPGVYVLRYVSRGRITVKKLIIR